MAYKIATWNVNSLGVRLGQVLDWLHAHQPDILALQELKLSDDQFPAQALREAGYDAVWLGQKTYNGVALLARTPLDAVQRNLPGLDDPQARLIAASVPLALGQTLRVVSAYFPNGQAPESDKFAYKLRWLAALHAWLQTELAQHPRLVLLGDFNITADDRDSFDPEGLRGQIHHTDVERQWLRDLTALGLHDAFRLFEQAPRSWSWWDYRNLAFRKNQGLRIDYALVSDTLRSAARACLIDKATRRLERPSDHAPVVLELDL